MHKYQYIWVLIFSVFASFLPFLVPPASKNRSFFAKKFPKKILTKKNTTGKKPVVFFFKRKTRHLFSFLELNF